MSYKAQDVVEGEILANLATFFIAAIIIFILFNFTLEVTKQIAIPTYFANSRT